MTWRVLVVLGMTGVVADSVVAADPAIDARFRWTSSAPLLSARDVDGWPWHAVKDPSSVAHNGRLHLFATVRGSDRSHAIVYCSFTDWSEADAAPRRILPMHPGYFCAPQVFYFTPHQKWYLICQAANEAWGEPVYRAAYSTTDDIANPDSWSPLQPLFEPNPPDSRIGLDFWVICDDAKAHLFSTTNDGRMWRRETLRGDFPLGWSPPVLALQDDVFEASHTYRLRGRQDFLTIIEAQNGPGWRYYKAYVADALDGEWRPLAATKELTFASLLNVEHPAGRWTDSISHGELIREGADESMEIDPAYIRGFVFQGVLDPDRRGKKYGEIPWKLGVLTPAGVPSPLERD
jgi:hypothetical protein